jgi:CHAT domain-containing protein
MIAVSFSSFNKLPGLIVLLLVCFSAQACFAQGRYPEALGAFQQLADDAQKRHDTNELASCLLSLAACQQSLGLYCEALENLDKAKSLIATVDGSSLLRAQFETSLGSAYAATRKYVEGEQLLRSGLQTATQLQDGPTRMAALQNLGNLLSTRQHESQSAMENTRGTKLVLVPSRITPLQEALKCYAEAIKLAQSGQHQPTLVRLLLNQSRAQMKAGNGADAQASTAKAAKLLNELPDSREKGFLAVSVGRALCDLDVFGGNNSSNCCATAFDLLEQAKRIALEANDARTASFAWGYLADIQHRRKELDAALFCAEKAIFLAQQAGADDARFHWEWLVGSILRDQAQQDRALKWYRQAVQTLQSRRADFYAGSSLRAFGTSFHENINSVYYELADLLLKKAGAPLTDASQARAFTLEALQTVEMLKTIEIESFFLEDDCTSLLQKQSRNLEQAAAHTAVIYIIPLSDRTEMVLCLDSGLRRITTPVTSRQIADEARRLRTALETPASNDYQEPAQQLSDWLIQPLVPGLKARGVKTLIFVPDAALRGIPMAVLHDGRHYLMEDYSIAVSPGLSLLGAGPVSRRRSEALLCGISKPVQNHAGLKHVPVELADIGGLFKGTVMLDEQFQTRTLQQELLRNEASIVHIASHAHFGGDAQQSYILAFDERMTIQRLEEMISPRLLSPTPIELFTLSACQTAAGDERAALGLAGVAIKSGARSTLATLWSVNDESTQRLMTSFYQSLKSQPQAGKAKALQAAQRQLLGEERFRHPFFWSPYLLIGDWM